ncbi:MAG: c-type cytochrome [Deltaproteobacteria bacterium]|nr:c-type cytochrome [Deltaproteobacteria bacterium]
MRHVLAVRRVVLVAVAIGLAAWGRPPRATPRALPGWQLYDRYCVACHGSSGDGLGPAAPFTWGRPRALTSGEFHWRSTPVGKPPTDDDLRLTLRHGAIGTSMPGFAGVLTDHEIDELLAIIKAFAPAAAPGSPVQLAAPPAANAERGAALWAQLGCVACHGASGEGAKALSPPPYDLRAFPIRRPRETDDHAARRAATAMSIATGLTGTAMPGYAGSVPDADLWALADHVLALGARATRKDRSQLDPAEIAADRTARIVVGTWPARGEDAIVFGAPVAPQGPVPPSLAPAQASLSAQQCARCHAKQYREWQGSIHAAAASPGLIAQLDYSLGAVQGESCQRCHDPLAEQRTDRSLRSEGISCAGCHVRSWERHGPPDVSPSLLPLASYPLKTLEIYERGDFCMPCHQLPPRTAVNGKPLLNTYKEWLEGPYMRRGVQCQHCHMPNREHTVLGIHDRATFRQGYELAADAFRKGGALSVLAELTNVGAGHYLPTTPTPVVWLRVELLDDRGAVIEGASAELRIGRDIYFDTAWHERADTRIPPGERAVLARAWRGGRTGAATAARITVEVHPDSYYEGLYAVRLRGKLAPEARALNEQALARARSTHYIAEQRTIPVR